MIILITLLFILTILLIFKLFSCNLIIKNLKLENQNLSQLNDETRIFRHDFQNIIQAFGGYIWANDFEGLKKYYSQLFNNCVQLNNLSKLNSNLINDPAIFGILTNKFSQAANQNIRFNIDIFSDFQKIDFPSFELSKILGILLDNAIEASNECNEKTINFIFREDKTKKILLIENTYNNKEICINDIYQKNFSTKQRNSGIGLWEVKKILNKYKNSSLYTSKGEKYFSQQLEFFNT